MAGISLEAMDLRHKCSCTGSQAFPWESWGVVGLREPRFSLQMPVKGSGLLSGAPGTWVGTRGGLERGVKQSSPVWPQGPGSIQARKRSSTHLEASSQARWWPPVPLRTPGPAWPRALATGPSSEKKQQNSETKDTASGVGLPGLDSRTGVNYLYLSLAVIRWA